MSASIAKPGHERISRVTRAVVISQMLFTAGHSLTSGGFLYYFVSEFDRLRESAVLMALVQITPETFEAFSFFTREILRWIPHRKWLWGLCLVAGRSCSMLIPLALIWANDASPPVAVILIGIATWHLFQGIAYCSYISWLSDLIPEMNWGRFFAKRKIASLAIAMTIPIIAGTVRDAYLKDPSLSHEWQRLSYAGLFGLGTLLVLASLWPMIPIPDIPLRSEQQSDVVVTRSRFVMSRNFYWLLASRWWLSFFQGLTQAVMFGFSAFYLKFSVTEYYLLSSIMLSLQMVTSWIGGKICDRQRDRQLLFWSLLFVSSAMAFLYFATPQYKWLLLGAYVVWGGFGFVNIALQSLTLKLAPESDNTSQIAWSRQFSGLIAGAAGLMGGLWFDSLLEDYEWSKPTAYQLLFATSFLGRFTAPLWLLPIRTRDGAHSSSAETDSVGTNVTSSPT